MKISWLLYLTLLGCGLRKPYGSPCPPAPAREALPPPGAYIAPRSGATWICSADTDVIIVENEAREATIYCAPKTKLEVEGIER